MQIALFGYFEKGTDFYMEKEDYLKEKCNALIERNKEKDAELEKLRLKMNELQEMQRKQEELAELQREKRNVNKILIGIAGTQSRIGCTHICISLASFLKKRGYDVAAVEFAENNAFDYIKKSYGKNGKQPLFTINGVDYYSQMKLEDVIQVLSNSSYHFLIMDLGVLQECDMAMYHKCDMRLLICGSKPWENIYTYELFKTMDSGLLQQLHFIFNLTAETMQREIRKEMSGLNRVYFFPLTDDPFSVEDIGDFENVFEDMAEPEEKKNMLEKVWDRLGVAYESIRKYN